MYALNNRIQNKNKNEIKQNIIRKYYTFGKIFRRYIHIIQFVLFRPRKALSLRPYIVHNNCVFYNIL